jgi:predicted SpoU family rRNA methylase
MADQTTLIVAIGTENKAKVSALKLSLQRMFPGRSFYVRTATVRYFGAKTAYLLYTSIFTFALVI